MTFFTSKYTALILASTIIALLWVMHYFSLFSLLNGYSYDAFMRTYPSNIASEKVIVIEIASDFALQKEEGWKAILAELLAADAEAIALTSFPSDADRQFYQLATASNKTIFAARIAHKTHDTTDVELQIPEAARNASVKHGLISKPPSQHGVFREQHSFVRIRDVLYPGFETKIAQTVLPESAELPKTDYRVNFIGNQARIPRINIERVLKGGLISELVIGRTVLVGFNQSPNLSGFFTPVSTDERVMSEIMFHAFALDTLLSKRQIRDLPDWIFVLVLVLVTVISLFVGQWLGFRMSLNASIVLSCIYILTCWVLLGQLFIWIPLVELILAQWLGFILVWAYRVNQEQKSLEQLLFGFPLRTKEKTSPVNLYNSDEPWDLLISIINQSLNLNRIIFLERIPDDHRLREIRSMNCSMSDILEKRRDYQRVPYSRAINANRPILLEKNYLKQVSVVEHQYMAPLIFAGEVLGFWVYTVEPDKVRSQAKFNALTYSFMVQVSEVLHYRYEWKKSFGNEHNKLWNYLRIAGNEQIQQLNQSATLIDKRVYELQEVFNSINTSCILYDLFGRVLMTNRDMDTLAQQTGFRLFNMTMLEFITEITEFDEIGARNLIQSVIFDHESTSIPVAHKDIERSFMMYILPLRYDDKARIESIPDESQVFQVSGVLCQLVDVTELKKLYRLKEQMFQHFCSRLREDLDSIVSLTPELEEVLVSEATELSEPQQIRSKARNMLDMLEEVDKHINVDIELMLTDNQLCYPVDAKVAIKTVIARLQKQINQREINLYLDLPDQLSLVYASPVELEVVLLVVLQMMIEDTYEADELVIKVEQNEQFMTCRIVNSGIGISAHQLQNQTENSDIENRDVINFNYAIHCINRWGGSLDISSEMGEGSRVDLVLQCFL